MRSLHRQVSIHLDVFFLYRGRPLCRGGGRLYAVSRHLTCRASVNFQQTSTKTLDLFIGLDPWMHTVSVRYALYTFK